MYNKKIVLMGLAFFVFILSPVLWVSAAEEIDAYCVVPKEAVPHGSTIALTIKFSDSDKSNNFIVQGPFKILRYEDGKAIIVDAKRGNDKDDTGKENTEKPTLTFNVSLSPKHKLPAPATESVTFTYFVKHKEGKRGELFATEREQQVDCSFTVQHESEEPTTPSGGIIPADLGVKNVGTLPTSNWYFLKEWRRGIARFFTFNSISKAELELKITNEKAAEILKIEEDKPDNSEVIKKAVENYTDAQERLKEKINALKETSENPNVEKLIDKIDEQISKHYVLFSQLVDRWDTDPYVEDVNIVKPEAVKDNHLQGAVDIAQKNIPEIITASVQKEKDIQQRAEEQIKQAEEVIKELTVELAEFAINEPGVPNAKTGPVRLDPTPARISTNMTIERQTPKRDFGDRMKAGLDTAGGMLANAKISFSDGRFGEAFGLAISAEMQAGSLLSKVNKVDSFTIKQKTTTSVTEEPETVCAKEYKPVCGTNGKTYSNSCMATASGIAIEYEDVCKSIKIEEQPVELSPISSSMPVPESPEVKETVVIKQFTLEADDYGFYPSSQITVSKGDNVELTFKVKTINVYYAGLDIKSLKFDTGKIEPGGSKTVSFIADQSFTFTSYWPATGVVKSNGNITVQ